jgi:hypothetical protein
MNGVSIKRFSHLWLVQIIWWMNCWIDGCLALMMRWVMHLKMIGWMRAAIDGFFLNMSFVIYPFVAVDLV